MQPTGIHALQVLDDSARHLPWEIGFAATRPD